MLSPLATVSIGAEIFLSASILLPRLIVPAVTPAGGGGGAGSGAGVGAGGGAGSSALEQPTSTSSAVPSSSDRHFLLMFRSPCLFGRCFFTVKESSVSGLGKSCRDPSEDPYLLRRFASMRWRPHIPVLRF